MARSTTIRAAYQTPNGYSSEPGYCWYCDCDIACPDHPSTDCGACEYACHCSEHKPVYSDDCAPSCVTDIAAGLGRSAFANGIKAIPAFDPRVLELIKASNRAASALYAWNVAWHVANVTQPI